MNRVLLYIVCIVVSFSTLAKGDKNTNKSSVWKQERKAIRYEKNKKYKGPDEWYTDGPGSMRDRSLDNGGNNGGSFNPQKYNPQQIKRNRQRRNAGFDRGGGTGDGVYDPEIDKPDPLEFPEFDSTDVDAPDMDPPTIPAMFWKVLGFILLFAAVIIVVYLWLKNKEPEDKKIRVQSLENDWNPEVITKTELELLLEKYTQDENYRECVRVYFTFILKEIIKKGWIKWKQDKTNLDYILEMRGKPESQRFEESVRIYDMIWYGEYEINRTVFESIQPALLSYYQSLQNTK